MGLRAEAPLKLTGFTAWMITGGRGNEQSPSRRTEGAGGDTPQESRMTSESRERWALQVTDLLSPYPTRSAGDSTGSYRLDERRALVAALP